MLSFIMFTLLPNTRRYAHPVPRLKITNMINITVRSGSKECV